LLNGTKQYSLESEQAQANDFEGNTISRGGTEVLLGDSLLRAAERFVCFFAFAVNLGF